MYSQYLRDTNPKTGAAANFLKDEDMERVVRTLAKLALQPNFIPKEFSIEAARNSLRQNGWVEFEKVDPIERLINNGVIFPKKVGAYSMIQFVLEPVAESMGAFAYAEECGTDEESWKRVLGASAAAPGFQLALELIRQAYGERFGWPMDQNM